MNMWKFMVSRGPLLFSGWLAGRRSLPLMVPWMLRSVVLPLIDAHTRQRKKPTTTCCLLRLKDNHDRIQKKMHKCCMQSASCHMQRRRPILEAQTLYSRPTWPSEAQSSSACKDSHYSWTRITITTHQI